MYPCMNIIINSNMHLCMLQCEALSENIQHLLNSVKALSYQLYTAVGE